MRKLLLIKHLQTYVPTYRVRQNYGNQGLMERYKFNSVSAINLTKLNLFINVNEQI